MVKCPSERRVWAPQRLSAPHCQNHPATPKPRLSDRTAESTTTQSSTGEMIFDPDFRSWNDWRSALLMVKPETVIGWHRQGFRLYWRWKSRHGYGRPAVTPEVRNLIRQMSHANPGWGAPRTHRELLKIGIEVCQATVAKYMVRHRKPPSQTWRTFLRNHTKDLGSLDFFVVPASPPHAQSCLIEAGFQTLA
jgi:hypothetical protein